MVGKQVTIEGGKVLIKNGDVVEQVMPTKDNLGIRKIRKPAKRIVLENLTEEEALALNFDQTNDYKDTVVGSRRRRSPKRKDNTKLTVGE